MRTQSDGLKVTQHDPVIGAGYHTHSITINLIGIIDGQLNGAVLTIPCDICGIAAIADLTIGKRILYTNGRTCHPQRGDQGDCQAESGTLGHFS
ncbi:MAG: hypothetical protein HC898_03120 [Phycisphaerales bacterium]|nr:hypothetical protein [Phycisphaerales bacterium]